VRIASLAVSSGFTRQRPSLEGKRSVQYNGRTAASPSGFERHAATLNVWPACPGTLTHRVGALPRTSSSEVGAAVHL
jgi:hypothetical protein